MTTAVTPATRPALADVISEIGGPAACLSLSKDPDAKVTLLLFQPGHDRPAYVAKLPTTDAASRRVEREAARLRDLERRDLGPVAATIPRLIAVAEHLGRPVLVTSALPGPTMLTTYHAWRHTARPAAVAADFAAAGRWLSALHHHTAGGAVDLASVLDGVGAAVARRFARDAAISEITDRIAALHDRLVGQPIAGSVVHGDFWPGNLLVAAGRVCGVIDWEESRPHGPPVHDIARFAIAYSLYLDRHTRPGRAVPGHRGLRAGRWGAGVEYAVDGSGWYPDMVRRFVAGSLERLGVPARCGRDILLAGLAAIAAEANHPGFAREHLQLFRRLSILDPA